MEVNDPRRKLAMASEAKAQPVEIKHLDGELSLFNNFLGRKLRLKMDSSIPTACTDCKSIIRLNPSSAVVTGDQTARALLQHEEAHNLFGTNDEIPTKLAEEYPKMKELVPDVYDILEDYRIENLWQIIFPGSSRNFQDLYASSIESIRNGLGNREIDNPIGALAVARFGLSGGTLELEMRLSNDMRPVYNKFVEELKKLDGKDYMATYPVAKNVLEIVKDWAQQRQEQQGGQGQWGQGGRSGQQTQSGQQGSTREESQSENGGGTSEEEQYEKLKEALEELSKKVPLLKDEKSMGRSGDGNETKERLDNAAGKSSDEILGESADKLRMQLEQIFDNKQQVSALRNMREQIEIKNGSEENGDENWKVRRLVYNHRDVSTDYSNGTDEYEGPPILPSQTVRNLLEKIKRGNELGKWHESAGGPRLDMKKLIRYNVTRDPSLLERMYLERNRTDGVEFITCIDISGSMAGEKINIAKSALGSVYDSLRGSTLVKMKMFGFYGADNGPHVFKFDRKSMMSLGAGGNTPTDAMLGYMTDYLQRNRTANDPVLILITDGHPDSFENTKLALDELVSKLNIQVFTIFVSSDSDLQVERTFSASTAFYRLREMSEVRGVLEGIIARDISLRARLKVRK